MALTKINTNLIAVNTIAASNIADNALDATKIASNSILTRHIDDDQVTGDQLADNLTIAGTLASTGVLTANAGVVVDNITIDGTTIALSSGNMTLDVAGDIVLDADGGDIYFEDAGTTIGHFQNSSSDFVIKSSASDKDLIFKGNDGGSTITALTLDMSAGGTAIFGGDISMGTNQIIFDNNSQAIQIKDTAGTTSYVLYQDNADTLVIGNATNVEKIRLDTGGNSGALTIDTNGNVGIGTESPTTHYEKVLHIHEASGSPAIHLTNNTTGSTINDGTDLIQYGSTFYIWNREAGNIQMGTSATERLRIDSAGALMLYYDDTVLTIADAGTNAAMIKTGAGDECYYGSDNMDGYLQMKTDGNSQIYSPNNFWMNIGGSTRYGGDTAQFYPATNNTYNLGHSSYRWANIYSVSTDFSSDARLKTTLTALTDNEIKASKLLAKEIGTYKWLKDVSEEGDKAKINVGLTAQKVIEIMNSCSLNALDYKMVSYSEWEAEDAVMGRRLDKDNKTEEYEEKPAREAGNEYGVAYEQINQFIAAGFNARLKTLEDA